MLARLEIGPVEFGLRKCDHFPKLVVASEIVPLLDNHTISPRRTWNVKHLSAKFLHDSVLPLSPGHAEGMELNTTATARSRSMLLWM